MDIFTISGIDYDSNVYLITGKIPTIVDTGTGFHSTEVIREIQKYIEPSTIQQIILTHEHFDHVGGTLDILKATKGLAKLFAHQDVVQKLREGKSTFAEMLGGVMPKLQVDTPLRGGEQILCGNETFRVEATPGHSPGSICLYGSLSKSLVSGDTVFAGGGFGRYDFPGGNQQLLLHSITRLAALDILNLYPGHGPIVEGAGQDHVRQALETIKLMV